MHLGKCNPMAAIVLLSLAAPAAAQYYVPYYVPDFAGMNDAQKSEWACRRGNPTHPSEVTASTSRASALMQAYFETVRTDQVPLPLFIANDKTRWTAKGTSLGGKNLAAIKDPFAVAGNTLEPKPLKFVRSGDGSTALGQWQVRDAAGAPVGTYQALLRFKKTWLFSSIELIEAGAWADPVVQYCHVPGDVLGYRLAEGKSAVAEAQRRLTPARQAEAAARASADKARAAAEAAPDNAGKQAAAKQAAEKLRQAADVANGYQSQYDTQRAILDKAEAEQKALEDQRSAGRAAPAAQP